MYFPPVLVNKKFRLEKQRQSAVKREMDVKKGIDVYDWVTKNPKNCKIDVHRNQMTQKGKSSSKRNNFSMCLYPLYPAALLVVQILKKLLHNFTIIDGNTTLVLFYPD